MRRIFDNNILCKAKDIKTNEFTFNKVLTNDECNMIYKGLLNLTQNNILYIKSYELTNYRLLITCKNDMFNYVFNALAFLNVIDFIEIR